MVAPRESLAAPLSLKVMEGICDDSPDSSELQPDVTSSNVATADAIHATISRCLQIAGLLPSICQTKVYPLLESTGRLGSAEGGVAGAANQSDFGTTTG